jgi:uncharacterized protein
MSRYQNEAEAAADGFTIVHEPERARYAVYAEGDRLVGEAHYSLLGDGEIDFDHTVVAPELRGSGISGLLAHRAVTGDAVGTRRVRASCWFIAGYLERHPELVGDAG